MTAAGFVWDPRVATHVYRDDHPLKPMRLVGVHDTLERLGAFARSDARLLTPRGARRDEIERIHDPEYVEVVMRASREPDNDYTRWGLSAWGDTPPFEGMHEISLLTTGATLTAMEEVLAGRGLRVAYVDIDAHHGDGVQAAFYETDQVLTISLHEYGFVPELGHMFFPGTGAADERGRGRGAGYSVNVALPMYTDDDPTAVPMTWWCRRCWSGTVPTCWSRSRGSIRTST